MGKFFSNKTPLAMALSAAVVLAASVCHAADESAARTPAGLYLKVELANRLHRSKLRPGDVLEGRLSRNVYSGERKVFSAGSQVRLPVDHLEKRRRIANDHWPWLIKVFTPRQENYPVFKAATVIQDSQESSLDVSLISMSRLREVQARAKTSRNPAADERGAVETTRSTGKALPTMVLEASGFETSAVAEQPASAGSPSFEPQTLPAGTQCRILLLGDVSASRSKPGDLVRARLLEPVFLNSRMILPAGSLLDGRVVRKTPPRRLSRAGSLYLTFTTLSLPEGTRIPIAASLAAAQLDAASHTRMDAEGRLQGERPGKAWMAINFGVSAGISKEMDDGAQLLIEALVSSATDASTAGTSRIVASAASGLYMLTRRGRDVVLPRLTEMEIALDRPLSLDLAPRMEAAAVPAGDK